MKLKKHVTRLALVFALGTAIFGTVDNVNAQTCCGRGLFRACRSACRQYTPSRCYQSCNPYQQYYSACAPCSRQMTYEYAPGVCSTGSCFTGTCSNGSCSIGSYSAPCTTGTCTTGTCTVETTPAPCQPAETTLEEPKLTPCEVESISNEVDEATSPCEAVETTCGIPSCLSCTSNPTCGESTAAQALLAYVNNIRAKYKRPALQLDLNLQAGAQAHSQEMARFNAGRWYPFVYHNRGCGHEIVAANSYSLQFATDVQWIQSYAHQIILLNPYYKYCGVGLARDASGRFFCTARFR